MNGLTAGLTWTFNDLSQSLGSGYVQFYPWLDVTFPDRTGDAARVLLSNSDPVTMTATVSLWLGAYPASEQLSSATGISYASGAWEIRLRIDEDLPIGTGGPTYTLLINGAEVLSFTDVGADHALRVFAHSLRDCELIVTHRLPHRGSPEVSTAVASEPVLEGWDHDLNPYGDDWLSPASGTSSTAHFAFLRPPSSDLISRLPGGVDLMLHYGWTVPDPSAVPPTHQAEVWRRAGSDAFALAGYVALPYEYRRFYRLPSYAAGRFWQQYPSTDGQLSSTDFGETLDEALLDTYNPMLGYRLCPSEALAEVPTGVLIQRNGLGLAVARPRNSESIVAYVPAADPDVSGGYVAAEATAVTIATDLRTGGDTGHWPRPLLTYRTDSRWEVFCLVNGYVKSWVSTAFDGSAWAAEDDQELGDEANLICPAVWRRRDGAVVIAGYHWEDACCYVWLRSAPGLAWTGPVAVGAPAYAVGCYLTERDDARMELGWRLGEPAVWTRFETVDPLGTWTEV